MAASLSCACTTMYPIFLSGYSDKVAGDQAFRGKKSRQGERKSKGISIVIKVLPHKTICLWSKTEKKVFILLKSSTLGR